MRKAATVADKRVSYLDAGEGPALVLLHGIGSAAVSWTAQIERLAPDYRVIAWDAPGYGGSDTLGIDRPVAQDYAERLAGLLGCLGIGQPVIVGHSLGALVAAAYAKRRGKPVRALILADPALGYARADAPTRQKKLDDRIAMFRRLGPKKLGEQRGPNLLSATATATAVQSVCDIMSEVRADGYLPAAHMLATGDLLADAAEFSGPALVLCGAEDNVTPPSDAKKAAAAIKGARYREIPRAGHASYVEQPDIFTAEIAAFLQDVHAAANGRA